MYEQCIRFFGPRLDTANSFNGLTSWMPIYMQTQTNIYEIVIEMNIRQLNIERRTDEIETELQRLQVTKNNHTTCITLPIPLYFKNCRLGCRLCNLCKG